MKRARTLPPRRHAGFTLVELLVALTVGGIAVSSIYAVGAAATRQFYRQQQLATAQTSLRTALDQVKRDVARAGYLATPRVDLPGTACSIPTTPMHDPTGPTGPLAAFTRFEDDVPKSASNGNFDPTGMNQANGYTVDDVVLFANYASSAEYPGVSLVDSNTVGITPSQSYDRDFTGWFRNPATTFEIAAFNRVFATNRLIRIRTGSGQFHFATVQGTVAPSGTQSARVDFTPAVPAGCTGGLAGGQGWIAPVSAIRYTVANAPDGYVLDEDATGPMAQLLRVEVQPGDKRTPLAGVPNTRAILDYVVGFNLQFVMSSTTAANTPDVYDPGVPVPNTSLPNDADDQVAANPERIRSVVIELAVRTPEQDPTMPWAVVDVDAGVGNCGLLPCHQVFPGTQQPGAARVRTARTEVFVPNVAMEGW